MRLAYLLGKLIGFFAMGVLAYIPFWLIEYLESEPPRSEVQKLIVGAATTAITVLVAVPIGRWSLALYYGHYGYVPAWFWSWPRRWAVYYIPMLVLTVVSAMLMPNWRGSGIVVLVTWTSFSYGYHSHYARNFKWHYHACLAEGVEHDEALEQARRIMAGLDAARRWRLRR